MHNDGVVVAPLHKAATDQATHPPLARLPVVVLQVRDKAAQQLRHGLQALFDNADDTLFEMADRAQDDVDQNPFFEAMRDLRLKRKSIERGCFSSNSSRGSSASVTATRYQTALPRSVSGDPPVRCRATSWSEPRRWRRWSPRRSVATAVPWANSPLG